MRLRACTRSASPAKAHTLTHPQPQAVYSIDEAQAIRKSHENQEVAALYAESALGSPNSHAAHEMLHTHYTDRSGGRGGA